MQVRDVTGETSGKIWHRKPAPTSGNGAIVSVLHSGDGVKTGRRRRFLKATFNQSGERVLAADHLGGIYVFDLMKNRFSKVQSCGQSCTAIASGLRRMNEYLVGLADSSVKCYTTDSKEMVSWMRGHDSAIHSISVHGSGRYAITTSRDTAQLWNLDTFERIRKLNVKSKVPIQKVFFLPISNTILTCFTDDSIFGWETDNFEWKYKLECSSQHRIGYKAFSATKDGKLLVCGGKSNLLHVYSLTSHQLSQVIKMPNEVQSVKQLEFLADKFDAGANKVLGVLSQDGVARFINVDTCQVLFELRCNDPRDKIIHVCVDGEGGDHIVASTDAGKMIIYSIRALDAQLNAAPGPLVKVVKDVWKRKSLRSQSETDASGQRSTKRPPNGNVSTGRIMARKLKPSKEMESDLPHGLSLPKLRRILRGYGEYPEKYRLFIWRSILKLPENQTAFSSLLDKGTHLAYASIQEKFPVKSGKLLRVMQRVLSSLAHWSVIFSELDYIPLISFPFIKLFQNNHLVCFEIIATILTNWCQHWFEFYPNPPINVLSLVENVLSHHDKELLQHFVKYNVTTQIYAWPLMQTLLSEVLTRDEWLRLFDNVFTNHPSFLIYCVVAYSICSRSALLRTRQTEDFTYFFHHRNALDIGAVISEAYRLSESTPANIDPRKSMDGFEPLPMGETYPIFNKYPKFIVDYQAQERERIRKDELEYLREKHIATELSEQMLDRKLHEDTWYRRKEMLEDAEEERRKLLIEEERKLVDQRKKLSAMKRELRVRELQLLDKSRMRFVDHQQTMKEIEIKRLEEELDRKAMLRNEEISATVEDVEVKGLELEANRASLEQQMAREQSELEDKIRADINRRRRLADIENKMNEKLKDERIDIKKTKELEQDLASVELKNNALRHHTQAAKSLLHSDIEREKVLATSLSRNIENLRKQREINTRLEQLRLNKEEELSTNRNRLRYLEDVRNEGDERRARMLQDRDLGESRRRIEESEKRMEEHIGRLREEHTQQQLNRSAAEDRMTAVSNKMCLNDVSDIEDSVQWSLDRSRGNLRTEERHLMDEVRNLRQRLVSQRKTPRN
uniref:TBC1 domain family member 31 n=1 Tax=Ciona intestinalis TaxID=7719 RepID=UPI000180D30F|nr:TBC1 domain family member 31 [Ciona intestinalis]|eukprot:XP_002130963.1 TBC1 domain family member 31 [Ciona intestinalis]